MSCIYRTGRRRCESYAEMTEQLRELQPLELSTAPSASSAIEMSEEWGTGKMIQKGLTHPFHDFYIFYILLSLF
jgi:hypothetical protein